MLIMDGATKFVRDAAARMPLAEAVLSVWRSVFDPETLNGLWERYRGRGYQKVIDFALMTKLVSDALLLHGGSGRRSFEKSIEAGVLACSPQAAFGKLGRLPLSVSDALLRDGSSLLRELYPAGAERPLPASLSGFDVLILDGKALKNVEKRLQGLRQVGGGLLGGKVLVAIEWRTGLARAMQSHPDGDASERPLVKDLVPQTDALVTGPRLFVGDRAYCDLTQPRHFTAREGDHFLVRYQSGTKFHPDNSRAPVTRTDGEGRTYVESFGWLGPEGNPNRLKVRRIHLQRPGEKEDLILVTDLLDALAYPAIDLLWLYRERWGIERMFQKVTEVFGLKEFIGGTPQACVFQFAFCLLLYNIIQLVTGYVAEAQKCDVEALSKEKLFDDVRDQLTAWDVVFSHEETLAFFPDALLIPDLRNHLRNLLSGVWSATWWKSKPQPNRKTPHRTGKRGHASVHRVMQAHAEKKKAEKKATESRNAKPSRPKTKPPRSKRT